METNIQQFPTLGPEHLFTGQYYKEIEPLSDGSIDYREHYYNLEHRSQEFEEKFFCGPCNRSFFSYRKYKIHTDDHVDCPFPECNLSACIKIIDQHISHQHMLVNFEALQVDDEKWIADRKARFPTLQRAEVRRAQCLEKLKRGERIGLKNRNKSLKTRDENLVKKNNNHNTNFIKKKVFSKNERKERIKQAFHSVDLYDSDDEIKRGIPAFKGLDTFYENTGETSLFGIKDNEIKDKIIDISGDEDEENWNKNEPEELKTPMLSNALGALIGSYNDSDEEIIDSKIVDKNITKEIIDENITQEIKNEKGTKRKRKKQHKKSLHNTNYNTQKQRRPKKRRPTLLEKLLENDIKKERNKILQCIRFIVNENYFDYCTK